MEVLQAAREGAEMTSVARHDSGDYSDASPQENEHDHSENDGRGQHESDYESAGSESGQSDTEGDPDKTQERRVDDDEDRSNPQYIPKRGTFYEHDDRTADNGEESLDAGSESTTNDKKEGTDTTNDRRRPPRKSDVINKWAHDKFIEKEQVPKSREELVAIYGYDIRNEDAPPHARRNRRYGRGPNKYTRTWEDEEAYKRQAAAQQLQRKPLTTEDFPELDASNKQIRKRVPRPRSKSQPSSNDSVDSSSLRRNQSMKKPSPRQHFNRERVGNRDNRDNRDSRDNRDNRENNREYRDNRDIRENRENNRDIRENRENNRDIRENREINRDIRENRENNRDIRENRENNRDIRENRENNRDIREKRENNRDIRENREGREYRLNREVKNNREEPKLPPIENLTITASVFGNNNQAPQRKVNATVAQQRPVPTQQAKKPPQSQPLTQQLPLKVAQQQQQQQQPKQQQQQPLQQQQQQLQQQIPEARTSKRYSSLRRPMETYQIPQHIGYNAEYPQNSNQTQGNSSHAPSQQLLQQVQQMHRSAANQSHGPSPPHQSVQQQMPQQMPQQQIQQQQIQQQQMPQQMPQQQIQQQQMPQQQIQQQQMPQQQIQQQQMPQQQIQQVQQQLQVRLLEQQLVSHPHHTLHNLPQQHAIGQMQQAQAYAPPAMMPAQYMQPQQTAAFPPAPMYAAPPPAPYTHPAHTQMYTPHHNYATQAGGLTYYGGLAVEPETPRAQRRPTAAIPIVRPENRPASSTEKDNIDRIVENMFVMKHWPGPGTPDASKDKERSQEPTSKESSQPNSLTSSSISIDSNTKPVETVGENEPNTKVDKTEVVTEPSPKPNVDCPSLEEQSVAEEHDAEANSIA